MAHHLSIKGKSNTLRHHLNKNKLQPEDCKFKLVACGPIQEEIKGEHQHNRDIVAAMECARAKDMKTAGYAVMNDVRCNATLDAKRYEDVRAAFAHWFPLLVERDPSAIC
jgi:hypothetical protein